jgi:hypothetical protein
MKTIACHSQRNQVFLTFLSLFLSLFITIDEKWIITGLVRLCDLGVMKGKSDSSRGALLVWRAF